MNIIDSLDRTFEHAHGVIGNVSVDQYDAPTPCDQWTVRDLLEHTIGVVAGLAGAAAGTAGPPFELGPDPTAQFDESQAALAAWRTDGVLDRTVDGGAGPMPGHVLAGINLLDTATHSWELATATGQPFELPEPVAIAALEASKATIAPEIRPGRFGPEMSVPADAGPTDRLVAFLGRRP